MFMIHVCSLLCRIFVLILTCILYRTIGLIDIWNVEPQNCLRFGPGCMVRVVSFPNIRGSVWVGSVGYFVGSGWVKKFGPMLISELFFSSSANIQQWASPFTAGVSWLSRPDQLTRLQTTSTWDGLQQTECSNREVYVELRVEWKHSSFS